MKEDSLSNKVYTELRGKILSNQLVPGNRLKEDAWAKKMDVSRVAVREALNRLLGENLVEKGERGGYFVKSMNEGDLHEIRELREVLELGALRIAFQHIKNEYIDELERICDDFTLMVRNGYYSGACEADVKFHETLFNIAGNKKLKNVYLASNIPLFHLKLGKASQMDDYELTDKEHRAIVKAFKLKDLKMAEEVLTQHLDRGELSALELT